MTVKAVAQALSVSRATVYKLVAEGALPCLRVTNAIRIRPEDLRTFIAGGASAEPSG